MRSRFKRCLKPNFYFKPLRTNPGTKLRYPLSSFPHPKLCASPWVTKTRGGKFHAKDGIHRSGRIVAGEFRGSPDPNLGKHLCWIFLREYKLVGDRLRFGPPKSEWVGSFAGRKGVSARGHRDRLQLSLRFRDLRLGIA